MKVLLEKTGLLFWFLYAGYSELPWLRRTRDRKRFTDEMIQIGYSSLPLVLLIGLFSGAIIAWQAAYQFRGLISLNLLGGQTSRIIVMEMAPVMTGLVIAGRVAAPYASAIASMRDNGQIDALKTLGINPIRYILMPYMLAISILLPVLTIFANTLGLTGCWFVSGFFLDISSETFWYSVQDFFNPSDLAGGLIKSVTFGIFIGIITGYAGFNSGHGKTGIRDAGTRAFVYSALMILISDFWLWFFLF